MADCRAYARGADDASAGYNRVRMMTGQHHHTHERTLRVLGDIFLKHQAQDKFALGFLHRHQDLQPGHVMVHRKRNDDEEVCTMEPLDSSAMYPSSFYMSDTDGFRPFEYSDVARAPPSREFMSELDAAFKRHEVDREFCVAHLEPSKGLLVERELRHRNGTITTRVEDEQYVGSGVITAWTFVSEGAGLVVKACRVCETQQSGGHRVT